MLALLLSATELLADGEGPDVSRELPIEAQMQFRPVIPPPNYVSKTPGLYSVSDWQTAIDTTWGTGLPTATKLTTYNSFWSTATTMGE